MRKIYKFFRFIVRGYIIPVHSSRRKIVVKLYQISLKKVIRWWKIKNSKRHQIRKILKKSRDKYFKNLPLRSVLNLRDDGRPKILVIPSAYPSRKSPLVGTFFQEQSNVMLPDFDVKILYGHRKELNGEGFSYSINNRLENPEGLYFYYDYCQLDPEIDNYQRMVWSYEVILDEIIENGWSPDVIHAHSSIYGGIVAHYLGKKFKVPVVLSEHMMFLLHDFSKFLQDKVFEAFEGVNLVNSLSTDKMRAILMHGIKCDPIVIGNMVDDELFNISDEKNSNELFEILIVAGASYIKDLQTFFKSIREIIDAGHEDIHATIIGNGVWGDENYSAHLKELKIEKYCSFVGTVARTDMPRYYNKCDVFVSSSIAEGFQVSILEAMVSGKPVVTTRHGGAEDNMRSENGILVGIRDFKAIADAIIKIKTHEVEFDPKTIRQTVVEKYGKVAFKKKIADIYDDLIEGK